MTRGYSENVSRGVLDRSYVGWGWQIWCWGFVGLDCPWNGQKREIKTKMVDFDYNFSWNRIFLIVITNDACIVINYDCLNCDRSAVHVRLGNFASALQDIELALKVILFTVHYISFHNLQKKLVTMILELLKQVCPIE